MDHILIPALKRIIGDNYGARYPMSWRQEASKNRYISSYYVANNHYVLLPEVMTNIIREHRDIDHRYRYFESFFFCTYTFGNKIAIPVGVVYRNSQRIVTNAFPQIDFVGINIDKIFVDIAWEVLSRHQTAIWYNEGRYLPVLDLFFDRVRYGSRDVYRHDEFASVKDLAGCKYTSHMFEGEAPYHILQFQAYQTVKTAFFKRQEIGDRHTISLHPDILSENIKKSNETFVSLYLTCISLFLSLLIFILGKSQRCYR